MRNLLYIRRNSHSSVKRYQICIGYIFTEKVLNSKTLLTYRSGLEAGAVGLALSYAVTLMGMFQWGVRQSAEVENLVRTSYYPHWHSNTYNNDYAS